MSLLAVSFCNQPAADDPNLAIVDTERGERQLLAVAPGVRASACGLAADAAHLYCAYTTDEGCAIAVLDRRDYRPVGTVALPSVRDVHSLVLDGDGFVVASTGTDEVVRCDDRGNAEVLWRAAPGGTDTRHVNALARVNGSLWCTAFGVRDGARWDDAVDGYVYDIGAGRIVARGFYQPHSLVESEGTVYLCDSARSALRTLDVDLRFVDGYARGLAIAGGRYFVGSSVGRRVPRTIAAVGNAASAGDAEGRCAVETGAFDATRPERRIVFDDVAREIYDVLIMA